MAPRTQITRRELYNLVWSTPMSKLAPQFGLSDHGLANICDRHRVPTPPRGYWAKKEAGKKVKQTIFASTDDPRLENIVLCGTDPLPADVLETIERARPVIPEPPPKPEPDTGAVLSLGQIHMAVRNTATALRRDKAQDGIARAFGPGLCGIEVGKGCVERAVRILDGVARGLETVGMRFQPNERDVVVHHADLKVALRLTEATRRVPHKMTPYEVHSMKRYGSSYIHKYDYERTATLRIAINSGYGPSGTTTKWVDGTHKTLEEKIPAVVTDVLVYFDVRKLEREKQAAAERERAELARRRVLAKKRDEREDARAAFLDKLIQQAAQARRLKAWLNEMPAHVDGEQYARMAAWAHERLRMLSIGLDSQNIEAALKQNKLFPDPSGDDLHDPLGEPPPGSIYGY